jgi:hypothetical protein
MSKQKLTRNKLKKLWDSFQWALMDNEIKISNWEMSCLMNGERMVISTKDKLNLTWLKA